MAKRRNAEDDPEKKKKKKKNAQQAKRAAKPQSKKPQKKKEKESAGAAGTPAPRRRRGARALGVPADLRADVITEIRAASPNPPSVITDDMDLADDLRMTNDLKRGLAGAFQQIARRFKAGARISLDDCGNLSDVKSAVALVASRAGF